MSLAPLRVLHSAQFFRLASTVRKYTVQGRQYDLPVGYARFKSTGVGGTDPMTGDASVLPDIEVRQQFNMGVYC